MKLYEISDAIRAALDHIDVDPETGEILSADALHAVEAEASDKIEPRPSTYASSMPRPRPPRTKPTA